VPNWHCQLNYTYNFFVFFNAESGISEGNIIDGILNEAEMLKMHKAYPATFAKNIDKDGAPVVIIAQFSTWDIRKAMLSGKRELMSRYFFVYESMSTAMRNLKASNWILLADLSNYSLRKHSCLPVSII
jgi:hypothetical protein